MGMEESDAWAMFEKEGVLLSKNTLSYIRLGFEQYFEGYYPASSILLLLAIESALRDLVVAVSGQPTISSRYGAFNVILPRKLIELISGTPELAQSLGKELVDFLSWFIGDSIGANYRNRVAHVLMDVSELDRSFASFLVWLHWKFSSFRVAGNL